ncbi:alcohol dehydrogenase [Sulfolobus acidocaldarius SUSAZ]|nr:alcohol dehydrogenase [Sulfolobus acidocaldarius SUSAZ]
MKAVILPGFKQGYKIDKNVQEPKAGKLEVVVKLRKAALCYRDLLQIQGFYPRSKYPLILGHEMVGEIEEVGEGVDGFKKEDLVTSLLYVPDWTCDNCKMGEEIYCNSRQLYAQELDGFFTERILLKANSLVKVPPGVSDEGAVVVPCVAAMIYRGLKRANVKQGDIVLVTGAGGGVGIHALQVAKALGAKVVGVTSEESKAKIVGKFSDYVVVGNKFAEEVRKGFGEPSIVVDNVGGPTLDESMRSLKIGGKIVQVGNIDPSVNFSLRLGYLVLKNVELIGHAGATKKDIVDTLEMVRQNKITPVIGGEVSIEDFDKALEMLKDRKRHGKILIKP